MYTRAIIIKSIVFITIFFILLNVFIIKNNPYLHEEIRYHTQIRNIAKSKAKYLILGDSQAAVIPKDYLNNDFYNMAFGSDGINEMYIKLLYALEHNHNIKAVLLNCSYNIFAESRKITNNKLFIKPFTPPHIYEQLYHEPYSKGILIDTITKYPPFNPNIYVFTRKKIFKIIKNIIQKPEYSLKQGEKSWANLPEGKRRELAEQRTKDTLTNIIIPEFVKTLKKTVALCKDKSIQIIGIRYPFSKDYMKAASNYNIKKVNGIIKKIPFDYFLNYENLCQDKKYFINQDHLSPYGLKLVVNRLFQDLRNLK